MTRSELSEKSPLGIALREVKAALAMDGVTRTVGSIYQDEDGKDQLDVVVHDARPKIDPKDATRKFAMFESYVAGEIRLFIPKEFTSMRLLTDFVLGTEFEGEGDLNIFRLAIFYARVDDRLQDAFSKAINRGEITVSDIEKLDPLIVRISDLSVRAFQLQKQRLQQLTMIPEQNLIGNRSCEEEVEEIQDLWKRLDLFLKKIENRPR